MGDIKFPRFGASFSIFFRYFNASFQFLHPSSGPHYFNDARNLVARAGTPPAFVG